MDNRLVLIEQGCLTEYKLDDKQEWLLGRVTSKNHPDIVVHSGTVSRQHGVFKCINGIWFYIDKYTVNGTIYNKKYVRPGMGGRVKPLMLENGDTFIFGSGENTTIDIDSVWALFISEADYDNWRTYEVKDKGAVVLENDGNIIRLHNYQMGTIIHGNKGYAIFMGDVIYLNGSMELKYTDGVLGVIRRRIISR